MARSVSGFRFWWARLGLGVFLCGLVFSLTGARAARAEKGLPATSPWNIEVLRQAPRSEWLETSGGVRSLFYEGEPYGGKPTRVFAYYATPGTLAGTKDVDHSLPAVVLLHGGGGTAFREWVELWARRGYAAIAMDLAGHRPVEGQNPHDRKNRTRLPDGGPDQGDAEKFGAIAQRAGEQWPYHAVAAAVRAHSLVRSFPEVQAEKTAVTGISWGGYLTCLVAGVDNRFRAAVPVYGCGYLHENSAWLKQFSAMRPDERERWIALWDPSQYLPAAAMPLLFVNGTNDFAYPLDSYQKSFACVRSPKQLRVSVNLPHSHPAGWAPVEIGLFIDHHLRGGAALPVMGEMRVEKDRIEIPFTSATKIASAALHFTDGTGPINMRSWKSVPAQVGAGLVKSEPPPAAATAWFVTLTDERAALVSSEIQFAPQGE